MSEEWSYLRPEKTSTGQVREKGSTFTGHLAAVESSEAAAEFLAGLKRRYHDARHHCWAFRIGWGELLKARSSDDGEPTGTAGAPILKSLETRGISDACLVVVRYFGGIKLGTGGLMRAYRETARLTLENAVLKPHLVTVTREITLPYKVQGSLRRAAEAMGVSLEEAGYGEAVTLRALVPKGEERRFDTLLTQLSSASQGAVTWK